ncbi:hypothetical protein CWI75_10705 [Kineobactrum sediminis]|uniref:Uncharacterized protein n=1 Tax=Kineobactrum sediminis TaxID=1905677 RepID=A0A2N5Y1G5_9GAMM|nr:hypothetical protein [Kineobactrum sediminis]PLW82240.1 hypothetical protein CWI75_10705 [Kineobactrum sediminis]
MNCYRYAFAVEEIKAADLSPDARAVALGGLNESQLKTGRRHLLVAQYIEQALAEGRTLAYAIETAATLYCFRDTRWPERIWQRHVQRKRAVLVSTA